MFPSSPKPRNYWDVKIEYENRTTITEKTYRHLTSTDDSMLQSFSWWEQRSDLFVYFRFVWCVISDLECIQCVNIIFCCTEKLGANPKKQDKSYLALMFSGRRLSAHQRFLGVSRRVLDTGNTIPKWGYRGCGIKRI